LLDFSLRIVLWRTDPRTSCSKNISPRATKLLQLRPCKATVVHALKEHVLLARIHFCNQFLQSVHNEAEPHFEVSLMRPGFHYMERWILKTAGIGVQKISFFMIKNWYLVDSKCKPWDNNFHARSQRVNNLLHWYTDCIWSDKVTFFSICSSTGEFLLDFLQSHSKSFSCLLHPQLNLPRLVVQHSATEVSDSHLSVKQEKTHSQKFLHTLQCCYILYIIKVTRLRNTWHNDLTSLLSSSWGS
jgi:hypothetical protein